MGNSHRIDVCGHGLRRTRCGLTSEYTNTGPATDIHSNGTAVSDTAPYGHTFAHSNSNSQAHVYANADACATTDSLTR